MNFPKNELKRYVISCSPDEYEKIKEMAKENRQSINKFILSKIFNNKYIEKN